MCVLSGYIGLEVEVEFPSNSEVEIKTMFINYITTYAS